MIYNPYSSFLTVFYKLYYKFYLNKPVPLNILLYIGTGLINIIWVLIFNVGLIHFFILKLFVTILISTHSDYLHSFKIELGKFFLNSLLTHNNTYILKIYIYQRHIRIIERLKDVLFLNDRLHIILITIPKNFF
jgi:hypothetical protein